MLLFIESLMLAFIESPDVVIYWFLSLMLLFIESLAFIESPDVVIYWFF